MHRPAEGNGEADTGRSAAQPQQTATTSHRAAHGTSPPTTASPESLQLSDLQSSRPDPVSEFGASKWLYLI